MAPAGEPRPRSDVAAYIDGPVMGLDCAGPNGRSRSGAGGYLSAQPGERVTLSLGELVLGSGPASASMTSIDLDPSSTPLRAGNRAANVARLLHSLGTDPDLVAGINVTDAHRAAAGRFTGKIDFDLLPEAFGVDPSVRALVAALRVELRSEHRGETTYGGVSTASRSAATSRFPCATARRCSPTSSCHQWDDRRPPCCAWGRMDERSASVRL